MSALSLQSQSVDTKKIYSDELQNRLRRFYGSREQAQYWAYNFKKAWSKYQRGVQQELELADMMSHWMDLKGARVLVIGSFLGSEAIAYALRARRWSGSISTSRPWGSPRICKSSTASRSRCM